MKHCDDVASSGTGDELQAAFQYIFGFFERGYRRHLGLYDRHTRRPWVFGHIAKAHDVLPDPARTIVVTGSKGKGSCVRFIATYLRKQGFSVGMIVSPEERHHLDRIRVNGNPIDEECFLRILGTFKSSLEQYQNDEGPDFYHPPTAIFLLIGLRYFQLSNVDYVVIEGGRGAQYDEISQLHPAVGVITSILPEHLGKLGPDLPDICADKFTLVHTSDKVLCSEQAWVKAQECGLALQGTNVTVVPTPVPLQADHPAWIYTADALARATLRVLGLNAGDVPRDRSLFASCQVITRELSPVLCDAQAVFLDGAVVPECLDFSYIRSVSSGGCAYVLGMTADKNWRALVDALNNQGFKDVFFFEPHSESGHISRPHDEQYIGHFDAENGLDSASRQALMKLIADFGRVYVIGVQIFLRSVRNALQCQDHA